MLKNFSKTTRGSYTTTWAPSVGTGYTNTVTKDSGLSQLASNPILKGDRHTPLPWLYYKDEITGLNGVIRSTEPDGSVLTQSGVFESGIGINTQTAIVEQTGLAKQKCIDNLYSALRGQTNLLASGAEMYKNDVVRTARKYVDFVIGWKRKIRKFTHTDASKAWLTAQYELIPLASDVYSVVSAIGGSMTRKGFAIECRGYSSRGWNPTSQTVQGIAFGVGQAGGQVEASCSGRFRFVVNPHLDLFTQLTGLDPLVVAWELLPWSFAIDWFYDIGGYLTNMETQARYASACKGGYLTTRYRSECKPSFSRTIKMGSSTVSCQVRGQAIQQGCDRQVVGSLPSVQQPRLNIDLGAGTLLNMAALLHVQLR